MKKNYALWLLVSVALVLSCAREDLSVKEDHYPGTSGFRIGSVNKIPFEDVIQKLPAGTLSPDLKFSYSPASGKTIEEFDIDTTQVNQILYDNGGESYTMKVIPKEGYKPEEELYNLTISLNNGETNEKIIRYDLENGEVIKDEDHTEVEYNTAGRMACYRLVFPCEYGFYHDDAHCEGGGWTVIYSCGSGGEGGTSGGSGGSGTGNPTGDGPATPTGGSHNPSDTGGGTSGGTNESACAKTQGQLNTATVKEVIQNLKTHLASGTGGEKGYGIKKNGTSTPTTENGDHSVNFGNPSLLTGGYHNHTGTGVNIFSAVDINTLIEVARYNGSANPTNAFMGLIAPNGIHYMIRFDGTQTDLPPVGEFKPEQLKQWNDEQWKEYLRSILDTTITMNEKIERILLSTLKKMGLQNKVILQKIDSDNKIFTIAENTNGSTTPVPCP